MKTQGTVPAGQLRRIALERQGLLRAAPFGRGPNATLKALEQLGYVQIDTISVVARAHDHVLRTRVPNYTAEHLDKLQRSGKAFEYWYHAAAYLPMRDYRFALPKMLAMARGEDRWLRSRDKRLMREVRKRVEVEGPTLARDFETPPRDASGWWNWKPTKRALEQLFMQGDLMISGREGFQKVYDLRERVLPADVDTREPSTAEMAAHLLDSTLRSHGFATQKGVTYGRRGAPLRSALKDHLHALLDAGELTTFLLPSGEKAFASPELLERRAPSAPARVRILSPFDSAVIQRQRSLAVFDFDYQIECYVTEEKRRFGYFCLPLLYRDRFVGRADCKAHRKTGRFEVKALHIEDPALADGQDAAFTPALVAALSAFAEFNGCREVVVTGVEPRAARKRMGLPDRFEI